MPLDSPAEFTEAFIDSEGFRFLCSFFIVLEKSSLEKSTKRNKSITIIIEIMLQLFGKTWYSKIQPHLTEQIVFDLFNQNLLVIHNFINAVLAQQQMQSNGTKIESDRILKNDMHLASTALSLMQLMILKQPALIKVLIAFPKIEQLFQIVFLQIENERIQARLAACLLDISKKLDHDKVMALQNGAVKISQLGPEEIPSVYFMKLFWTQHLRQALLFQKKTFVARELFSFVNKLMIETQVSKFLELVVPPLQFVAELCEMIRQRPILESSTNLNSEDFVLGGIFQLLKATLKTRQDMREQIPD